MTPLELDPRHTFETFVVGGASRLASGAARRVAESPGAIYNPLFIYSASGLGKTHLVTAIGHHIRRVHPDLQVVYDTLEQFMADVMVAIEAGERDAFRTRAGEVGLLILDDVQFLAGRHRTQEELLRVWDAISARGGQVVLTSDRPPQEIDGLDERLLSRFSGGLIVDIGAPDYETRVAIVRRKADERGHELAEGVAEALARIAFGNVRELQGALNRLVAVQELEARAVLSEEVPAVLGEPESRGDSAEFENFLAEISDTVGEFVDRTSTERRLADAILRWEGDGYRTRRLETVLEDADPDTPVEAVIRTFEADVERLREIAGEIATLEPDAPERIRLDVLRDPDRVDEAEALLGEVRERTRPLPAPPEEFSFERLALPPDLFAVRAAIAAAEQPGERYNPFFVHGPAGSGKTALLAALGERLQRGLPEGPVAFVEGAAFAAELIQALERNRADGWRARYRRAKALILDGLDALADTERAQDELFHLFELLHRTGVQLAFSATRPPHELEGLEERLRTRLESGLVVDLPTPAGSYDALDEEVTGETMNAGSRHGAVADDDAAVREAPDHDAARDSLADLHAPGDDAADEDAYEDAIEDADGEAAGDDAAGDGTQAPESASPEAYDREVELESASAAATAPIDDASVDDASVDDVSVDERSGHDSPVDDGVRGDETAADAQSGGDAGVEHGVTGASDTDEDRPRGPVDAVGQQPSAMAVGDAAGATVADEAAVPDPPDDTDDTASAGAALPAAVGMDQGRESVGEAIDGPDPWFLSREKLVWHWPYIEDRLAEDGE